jgi:hypothetical protein
MRLKYAPALIINPYYRIYSRLSIFFTFCLVQPGSYRKLLLSGAAPCTAGRLLRDFPKLRIAAFFAEDSSTIRQCGFTFTA